MMRVLIVDDEPLARQRLRDLLAAQTEVQIIGEAENGAEAVTRVETLRPDLLLLDVQMPDMDGFGVLRLLDAAALPLVIFVTAHDQYAVDAFEVSALDYLLKPVSRRRLTEALDKARVRLAAREQAQTLLANFLHTLPPRGYLQRLPVRAQQRLHHHQVGPVRPARHGQQPQTLPRQAREFDRPAARPRPPASGSAGGR